MTMKILVKKQKNRPKAEAFSIGSHTAELDEKQIRAFGLERPLRRLAKHLVGRCPRAIGINVHGVAFNWMLEPDEFRKE